MNSFTVGLFLDELSSFFEGLVLAPSALLVAGDFNFHVDDQEDDHARRFLQVLELFDLTQQVSHSTHKYGNTLDLIGHFRVHVYLFFKASLCAKFLL